MNIAAWAVWFFILALVVAVLLGFEIWRTRRGQ
jgi:hypothetical protein